MKHSATSPNPRTRGHLLPNTLPASVLAIALALAVCGCIIDDINDLRDIFNSNSTSNAPTGRFPDLCLSSITRQPDSPGAGEMVAISVIVRNGGRKTSPETRIEMRVGESRVGEVTVPTLKAGQSLSLSFPDKLALPTGISVVKLLADPSNQIKETIESNNCLATTVIVGEEQVRTNFSWSYEGASWTCDFGSPKQDLDALPQDRAVCTYEAYQGYVQPDDRTVNALAQILKFYAQTASYKSYEEVSFLLAFVQEMPYTSDEVTKGDNYPKYPIETLADKGGDCEDTSALLASITANEKYFNYGTALIVIDDHMAVGVTGNEGVGGTYFEVGGRRYYYCETTGKGYAIGELPEQYVGAELKRLIPIA